MLAMGRLWPMKVPYVQRVDNKVELAPWKNRHIYAILLLAAMVAMFLLFSPAGIAK
jgi:SSS family solute:Na+ symporter